MDSNSRLKVIQAGFTIIRTDDSPNIRIKYMSNEVRNWNTHSTYKTKAARDRQFTDMLKKEKYISD